MCRSWCHQIFTGATSRREDRLALLAKKGIGKKQEHQELTRRYFLAFSRIVKECWEQSRVPERSKRNTSMVNFGLKMHTDQYDP